MLFDPTEAIFDGASSLVGRIALALVAFALAFFSYFVFECGFEMEILLGLPLIALGMIFAWAGGGLLFFVGISAFLAFWVLTWKFVDSVNPKVHFALLYIVSFIYWIPLMWPGGLEVWKTLLGGLTLLLGYGLLAYGLPGAVYGISQLKKSKAQ